MAKIKWDQTGQRFYKAGVDHGVLYPQKNGAYPEGFAWNGLTTVSLNPTGAEDNAQYADNMKYLNLKSAEDLGATIECFMYPDEWKACNGEKNIMNGVTIGQQRRNTFGFSYRNKVGNDTEGEDYGFEIHVLYGCSSAPSDQSNTTINESPNISTFSYTISTTPVNVSGIDDDGKPFKPTAHLVFDSTGMTRSEIEKVEEILYGKDGTGEDDQGTPGRLPLPDEWKTILAAG